MRRSVTREEDWVEVGTKGKTHYQRKGKTGRVDRPKGGKVQKIKSRGSKVPLGKRGTRESRKGSGQSSVKVESLSKPMVVKEIMTREYR